MDKGIRQKSIHSFPDGSAFCPGAPKRVDTASGMTLKKQNACLHAVRHAVEKKLRAYTASEAIIGWLILASGDKQLIEFCPTSTCV